MKIQPYLDLFEYQKDENSDAPKLREGYWCFKDAMSEATNSFSELIHSSDLDEDSAYTFTVEALQAMQEIISNETHKKIVPDFYDLLSNVEEINDYAEAPIYNSELVGWMAKGANWTFIDEAIAENGNFDSNTSIINVIQYAYSRAWEEHYFKVLEIVRGQ